MILDKANNCLEKTYIVLRKSFNIESEDPLEQMATLKKIKEKMEKIHKDRVEQFVVGVVEERSSS